MTTQAQQTERPVELDITGMTCASCAARIEKKLNKVDRVRASVNYATERATVLAPPDVTAQQLIAAVEAAGYGAALPSPDAPSVDHAAQLRTRMWVAIVLSIPVIATAMVPAWQFPGWQWMSLVLATVVVWWCGRSFHHSALVNLRHGATTMDTLISLGTSAAYFWSVYALLFGHAGMIGMRHEFSFALQRSDGLGNIYFEAACGIITFLLIGRYIEARSKAEAGSALRALLELGAKEAVVLVDGVENRVPIAFVKPGDAFVVRPGEKVATDGEVIEGSSAVDNALITGESLPVDVAPGDAVIGGTINTTGRLVVRATAVGADTQLAHIARLIEGAQTGKANVQRLADKVSGIFVPVVIAIAVVTLVAWLVVGAGAGFAFTAAVAVLIIACPCALGLATPTALLVGTGRGAQLGIVIRGPEILETARNIDTVLLDKTGTVTTGEMSVSAVVPVGVTAGEMSVSAVGQVGVTAGEMSVSAVGQVGVTADELLAAAAAVEASSEHPIARAIVAAASSSPTLALSAGRRPSGGRTPGEGAESAASVPYARFSLHDPSSLTDDEAGWAHDPSSSRDGDVSAAHVQSSSRGDAGLAGHVRSSSRGDHAHTSHDPSSSGRLRASDPVTDFENLPGRGVRAVVSGREVLAGKASLMPAGSDVGESTAAATVVHVAIDGRYAGRIEVSDTIKPTSRAAIAQFRALGLTPVLLTGDNEAVARRVAADVGIDEVIADALPADKVDRVRALQESGRRVAMVGDGVNDAAALTQANLGIAMGSGTDVAIAASDLTLMRPDLMLAADAVRLSRRTLATIKGNLFWAFAYNTAAIPVAALGLLNPMLAGAAMAFSSVFVVLNSLRLRGFRPTAS